MALSEPAACLTGGRRDTIPVRHGHTRQPAPYGVATQEPEGWQPIGWLCGIRRLGVCQSSPPDYNGVQTTVADRPAGWYTTHLSNIRATLGSRSYPYSLCPKRYCVDRPQPKQSSRLSGLLEQTTMLRDVQPWPARAVCHPRPRYRAFATLHHTTQLSGLPFSRGIPLPPGLHGVQTETTHPMAQTVQRGWVHACRWASPTRSFAFSSVQPATTCESEVCNHASLHQPFTRRAQRGERGYEAPGRHGCPVDARSSNLAHSPFGPDRATTEG